MSERERALKETLPARRSSLSVVPRAGARESKLSEFRRDPLCQSELFSLVDPVYNCAVSSPNPVTVESGSDERWTFLRDVVVFQLKMFLDNIRDFALMPVSLVAALIDLIFKGKGHGSLFYQVLRCGAHMEEVINVYSAIEAHGRPRVNPSYTVDAVIARLEGVLVRECAKGGTAASIKAAMD